MATSDGYERAQVDKIEVLCMWGVCVRLSTAAALLAYVHSYHLGKVPHICREHATRADARSALALLVSSVDAARAATTASIRRRIVRGRGPSVSMALRRG